MKASPDQIASEQLVFRLTGHAFQKNLQRRPVNGSLVASCVNERCLNSKLGRLGMQIHCPIARHTCLSAVNAVH